MTDKKPAPGFFSALRLGKKPPSAPSTPTNITPTTEVNTSSEGLNPFTARLSKNPFDAASQQSKPIDKSQLEINTNSLSARTNSAENNPQGRANSGKNSNGPSVSFSNFASSATSFAASMIPSTPTSMSKVAAALPSMPSFSSISMPPVSSMSPLGSITHAAEKSLSMMMPADFPTLFNTNKSKGSMGTYYDASATNDPLNEEEYTVSEEGREYLNICGHNLHSVLSNPRSNWGEAIFDVFYPGESDSYIGQYPGLPQVTSKDFDSFMKEFGELSNLYAKNHERPVREQLASSNVPSVAIANGNKIIISCHVDI